MINLEISIEKLNEIKKVIFEKNKSLEEIEEIKKKINDEILIILQQFDNKDVPIDE